jgi:hypothetical protein
MKRLWGRIAGVVLAGWLFTACESDSGWHGRYVSSPGEGIPVTLTLESDGKGLWVVDQETAPIRWQKREGSLWLHVKAGGVLIARPQNNEKTLAIALPGGENIVLKKAAN